MCQVVILTVKTQIFFSIYAPVLFIIIFLVSTYQRSLSTAPENYVIPKHQPSPIWKVSNDSTSSPKPQIYENFAKSFLTSALYSTIQKFWGLMNITPVWSKHQGVFTSSSCWLQDRIRKYAVLLFSPKMTWGWRSKCGCSLVHVRIRWSAFSLLSSSCVTRVSKSE